MAQIIMYPGQANSIATVLASNIDAVQTSITVADGSKLPTAPNLVTIGTGEDAETIVYLTKNGNTISDCTRGFQGTAKSWSSSTMVSRCFTAYDYDALRLNHVDLNSVVQSGVLSQPSIAIGLQKITNAGSVPVQPAINFSGNDYYNTNGVDGNCEDISKFFAGTTTLALDSNNKVFGSNSIKVTQSAAGETRITPNALNMVANKNYLVSCYFKCGTCTNWRIRLVKNGATFKYSANATSTTSFTRIGLLLTAAELADLDVPTSRFDILISATATGQYGYLDGFMINEIPAADTSLAIADLLAKYPYVDSYACLTNPYFEVRRNNLIRNGNGEEGTGWWLKSNSNVSNFLWATNVFGFSAPQYAGMYQKVNVRPNTDYYLSGSMGTNTQVYVFKGSTMFSEGAIRGGVGTFNTGAETSVCILVEYTGAGTGAGWFNSVMLVEGSSAPSGYKSCEMEKFVIEGQFTKDDKITIKDGKLSGLLSWKHKVLFGKSYDWQYSGDGVGYKYLALANKVLPQPQMGASDSWITIKPNGARLINGVMADGADRFWHGTLNTTYISIPDADSGWTESLNPNNDEAKCFMNGWKANYFFNGRYCFWQSVVDNSAPPCTIFTTLTSPVTAGATTLNVTSSAGMKVGDRIIAWGCIETQITAINSATQITVGSVTNNAPAGTYIYIVDNGSTDTRILTYCKNNVAPYYKGYQFHYKLFTPEAVTEINTPVRGNLWSLSTGDNYVYIDSGYVYGEVARPVYYSSGTLYIFNNTVYGQLYIFRNMTEDIFAVYRDGLFESKYYNNPTNVTSYAAYGKVDGSILATDFDANAVYTVDYQILKTTHVVSFASLTCSYNTGIVASVESLNKAIEGKQQKTQALDSLVSMSTHEEGYFSGWYRASRFSATTAYLNIFVPFIKNKNAIPIITVTVMAMNPRDANGAAYPMTLDMYSIAITSYTNGFVVKVTITNSTGVTYSLDNGIALGFMWSADCREVI